MASIGWLHLSDLHQGLKDQDWLWPSVKESFFDDLERLHRKAGPWDLVLFTGDLTQHGTRAHFQRLTETLAAFWKHLEVLGSKPLLFAVPGNHDLARPDSDRGVVKAMREWQRDSSLRESFWKKRSGEYRKLVNKVFGPFVQWQRSFLQKHPLPPGAALDVGLLPGDASLVIEKDGFRLGVVGLSSTFLQLEGGDYEGRLDLDPRQLHAVTGGDPAEWARRTHAALLLTHHPPAWLSPEAQDRLRETIAPPGRFLAHLYGHMHEPAATSIRIGCGSSATTVFSCDLGVLRERRAGSDRSRWILGEREDRKGAR
ncbi:MAG: metallophosphoesterase, partial [Polyangiaceae bacterium]|nr:metallophosphoesterase [Polyangiaceae bacterium]